MEIRENLELVAVEYENNDKKAVMTFLDAERGEVRQVNFNLQKYDQDSKKWVNDSAKEQKIEEACQELFKTDFAHLTDAIGTLHTVYLYDKFNSLQKMDYAEKFTEDMAGGIYQTEVKAVQVGEFGINILYDIEGKTYQSKHSFGNYVESMKKFFVDPNKKEAVYKKFLEKYGVPVEEAQSLVGHPLMVEVKKSFGDKYWGDIKKFPKKK